MTVGSFKVEFKPIFLHKYTFDHADPESVTLGTDPLHLRGLHQLNSLSFVDRFLGSVIEIYLSSS